MRRYVFLDADGTIEEDGWFGAVIEAPTGVVYVQQYGGTACLQGRAEGYYVPLGAWDPATGRDALRELREIFERDLKGTGLPGAPAGDLLTRIESAVEATVFWPSTPAANADSTRAHLRLDGSRLADLDEAWIPIVTPDGPGVLLWCNSD
ncbi:hypothetical protein GCM10009678_20580 [Actinomadura kijaniata]|uniref:Uncharacterized protein n=1 Tax=Actinomadura namibiensis TaxID=182080 RepID=A0A7W3LJ63_ACTNM|nr:DUF6210 family protein [Actinomadura namibiensis]MBA8949040.1 hypothetical protein [Actinomadura namibiensis]